MMKKRLTITLDENLLKRVDSMIDKKSVRNRSHAIETVLLDNLAPKVRVAVILAGGGLKSKTHPLLRKIAGKNLYNTTFGLLAKHGIRKVVMCAGEYTDLLSNEIGDAVGGISIVYLKETKKLGTSGIVAKAKRHTAGDFLVLHADVLTDINLERLFEFHFHEETVATMAVKPRKAEQNYGKVIMQGNKITEFLGAKGERGLSIVNTGIYILSEKIFDLIPKNKPSTFEDNIFPALAGKGQLGAYLFQGSWYNITRDYKQANQKWKN